MNSKNYQIVFAVLFALLCVETAQSKEKEVTTGIQIDRYIGYKIVAPNKVVEVSGAHTRIDSEPRIEYIPLKIDEGFCPDGANYVETKRRYKISECKVPLNQLSEGATYISGYCFWIQEYDEIESDFGSADLRTPKFITKKADLKNEGFFGKKCECDNPDAKVRVLEDKNYAKVMICESQKY